ncbi:ATP-dependent DNA helicase, Rep family [Clostridium amylolyticum]|uniref:ATP-dependent DNA helicase, Rep family n=1 Tax=Clostridium amylolyticum TaxID=1121298 RepID=A0A1M6C069_9CLOT|nr:AAA family ATPase [Clostridium amylolyticum]SHI54078.1 ATP-dependent DNA helicase, Rep family [Clostridium amylolyticum]
MSNFKESQKEELLYLEKTLSIIKTEFEKENESLKLKLSKVIASRREMWEKSAHSSEDFDNIPEMNQYLNEVNIETRGFSSIEKRINKYKRMLKSPYFGRFDFAEEGFNDVETIYVGLYSFIDKRTDDIYVYDWRAPISSIFYRNELGKGFYKSPVGIIYGDVLLKRQYKIEDSKLKYFFDSSIRINDEILQEVLSRNSSDKMKSIVETIQKEQDIIIRDTENELLIVQGVAGSGKTSIALHRIAFLLYEGLSSKLGINNIIIISPNSIFSKYISDVLPELGEENVKQLTFDDFVLGEKRQKQMETLIQLQGSNEFHLKLESIKFKGSNEFVKILHRLLKYYERQFIPFKDVYYNGKTIETAQELKGTFLNNKIDMPIAKRLKRIEGMMLNKIHPLRKDRLKLIEKAVERSTENHMLEIKSFSRLIAIKEANRLMEYIHSFTEVDYMSLYKMLFQNKNLFFKLAKGIKLPKNIDKIISETNKNLNIGVISYEDSTALLFTKLMLEGNEEFGEIKQVVIDEAQDYYPIHYHIFKLLFKNARYTVLGDFNQTLEKNSDENLYDYIEEVLNKRNSLKLTLKKSYRSSFEINAFNERILNNKNEIISFERHEAYPRVKRNEDLSEINNSILEDVDKFYEMGYKSIAIICKNLKEAKDIQERLSADIDIKILDESCYENKSSLLVMPSYLAKGLEFDVVLAYNASKENYNSEFDKRLLYIACTRALHQLVLYYTGEKSDFIG